jgi:mannose-6-phosphate isomerase-like protein (cupin superfamily)
VRIARERDLEKTKPRRRGRCARLTNLAGWSQALRILDPFTLSQRESRMAMPKSASKPKLRLVGKPEAKAKPSKKRVAKFLLQHAKDAPFAGKGLRTFWEYRDLGLEDATGGRYSARIIRAKRFGKESTGIHFHTPDVQCFYVLKGWFKAEYRGQGVVKVEAGSFLHNPPGNPHNVFEYSDDLEFLEITAPAEYATVDVESVEHPAPVKRTVKRSA